MDTKKPPSRITNKEVKRARAKLVLLLGVELAKYGIMKAVMKEFIARGLDKTYATQIEAWKKYKDEKRFAVKLDKQMKDEIKRFQKTIKKWTPKELTEIVIEGLDE